MASAIDGTKPVAGSPTTQSVRDNFATAASEITALQSATGGVSGMTAGQIPIAASTTSVTSSIPTSTFLTPGTAASTYLPLAGGNVAGNLNVSGSVGIGTTGPAASSKLHVLGGDVGEMRVEGISFAKLIYNANSNVADKKKWQVYVGNTGSYLIDTLNDAEGYATNAMSIIRGTGTAISSVDFPAGSTRNVSGAWVVVSDASVKQDMEPYTRGLDAIVALNPVAFRYAKGTPFAEADKPSRPLFGLIADEVKPHVPEIVGTTTATIGKKEGVELSTLEPGNLIYALINAVKELNAEVKELNAKVAALESATVH